MKKVIPFVIGLGLVAITAAQDLPPFFKAGATISINTGDPDFPLTGLYLIQEIKGKWVHLIKDPYAGFRGDMIKAHNEDVKRSRITGEKFNTLPHEITTKADYMKWAPVLDAGWVSVDKMKHIVEIKDTYCDGLP